jgi:hypothetical protein
MAIDAAAVILASPCTSVLVTSVEGVTVYNQRCRLSTSMPAKKIRKLHRNFSHSDENLAGGDVKRSDLTIALRRVAVNASRRNSPRCPWAAQAGSGARVLPGCCYCSDQKEGFGLLTMSIPASTAWLTFARRRHETQPGNGGFDIHSSGRRRPQFALEGRLLLWVLSQSRTFSRAALKTRS